MSLNQRQWDVLCSLQGSDKPLGIRKLAQMVATNNKKASSKSFREMIARDLRDIKRITGAIESKKVLAENEKGQGYLENTYSWKSGGPGVMVKALTTAQSVALGVLQKVGLGLVPQTIVDELDPLFKEIHKNELVKEQSDKDVPKKITTRAVLAAEEKWLNKIAFLSETVGFLAPQVDPAIEKGTHEALYQEKIIEIEYKDKEFVVKPLALVQRGVRRYLIGIKRGYGEEAVFFMMSRIKKIRPVHVLEFSDVVGGEDFDLNAFLKKGLAYPVFDRELLGEMIDLKLWVDDQTQAWLIETPLAENQSIKKAVDGYEISVSVPLREELVYWILSMAHHVKVLKPTILRKRVAEDLSKSAKMYEAKA